MLIARCGTSVTLADALAVMTLLPVNAGDWTSVKPTDAVLVSGFGSPDWIARVSVKVNDPPGATLPPPAAMASASRFPSRVSVK